MKRGHQLVCQSSQKEIHSRCIWSTEEDELLVSLVSAYGEKKWRLITDAISKKLPQFQTKTPKQCRERWHTHLNPIINDAPWSMEEQSILFREHKIFGNKWAVIAEKLSGRTSNSVKNFFFCKLRKLARNIKNKVCEIEENKTKPEIMQTAYLLSHLYTQYFSYLKKEDLKEAQINGDKYVIDILSKNPDTLHYFMRYTKFFMAELNPNVIQEIIREYPYLDFSSLPEKEIQPSNELSGKYSTSPHNTSK